MELGRRKRRHIAPFSYDRMADGGSRLMSASFVGLDEVRAAVRALENQGYPANEISVLIRDRTRRHHLRTHPEFEGLDPDSYLLDNVELRKDSKTLKGVGAGGAIGVTLGAIGAAVAGIGATVVVPPLGVVVAGPIAAALTGAGAGGAVGGLVGGLTGAGMSEYRAKRLEKVLDQGSILLIARARSEVERERIHRTVEAAGGQLMSGEPRGDH